MKKVLMMLAIMLVTLTANAQRIIEGTFPSLKGQTKINLVIDYSNLVIANMSIRDWLECRQAEQPDYSAVNELEKELKPTVQEKLVEQINKKLQKRNAYIVTNNSAEYTLNVAPHDVAKKGNNKNECSILDKEGKVLVKFVVSGKGGTFGSMSNLWGDGYKDSGKKLGGILADCFKK